jgi:hypothetical protein
MWKLIWQRLNGQSLEFFSQRERERFIQSDSGTRSGKSLLLLTNFRIN